MKFFTAKCLSIMLLACAFASTVEASRVEYDESQPSCAASCYECGCNPLYCGAFDIQFQGGVDPILWRQRGSFAVVDCTLPPAAPAYSVLFDTPKFSTFFKTPWIVGGQVGYAWSDNVRVYGEFNYAQAKAKSAIAIAVTNPAIGTETYGLTLSKYSVFDAYAGVRYYFDRWCDRLSFFVGGKIGFAHHKTINLTAASVTVPPAAAVPFVTAAVPFYLRNNIVSGGANVGFDVCFCGNFSFVVTGEIVASCALRGSRAIVPAVGTIGTNFLVGGSGNELRFPVTAAIRYSF